MLLKSIISILLIACCTLVIAQNRGFKRVEGETVTDFGDLYSDLHALVIGNSAYVDSWPRLPGVKEDIPVLEAALRAQGFTVSSAVDLDKSALDSAFSAFIARYGTTPEAGLLFYFAGHGHTLTTNYGEKLGYLVPVNAPSPTDHPMLFQTKAMEMSQIEIYARRIVSKHALFVFDACFSGSVFSLTRAMPEIISYKTNQPVRQYISSGTEEEEVPDKSVFRNQFIAGLQGSADANNDGFVTGTELGSFLQGTVANYSKGAQHPQFGKSGNPSLNRGDFVFAYANEQHDHSSNQDLADLNTTGSIEVTTEQSGDLFLDGKLLSPVGAFSIVPIHEVQPGNHLLEIRNSRIWKKELVVNPSMVTPVYIENTLDRNGENAIELVFVRGGSFRMGSKIGETDELPLHDVTVNDFEIGAYEITVGQFEKFVNETSYVTSAEVEGWSWTFDGEWKKQKGLYWKLNSRQELAAKNDPVVYVSWNDCVAFTEWLSEKQGARFRLPTEAEWEYAARGGIHGGGFIYPGGEKPLILGWFQENSRGGSRQVGQRRSNELKIYDLAGNVWEWCLDWYSANYYRQSPLTNPKGGIAGDYRVLRGGSWNNKQDAGRVSNRHKNRPEERDGFTGFRVVKEIY